MRILEIVPPWIKPWPTKSYGAIERVIENLVPHLKALGHEVGISIEKQDAENRQLDYPCLEDALAQNWDWVHVHDPEQAKWIKELGYDYVATTHWSQHNNDTPEGLISREFVENAIGHLALCDRVAEGYQSYIIGQGVNLDVFKPRSKEQQISATKKTHVVMLGSYKSGHVPTVQPRQRKRFYHGLKALKNIKNSVLTIAGPGDQKYIRELCNDIGIDYNLVALPGNLEKDRLIELLYSATVLLHSATQEVVALSPLEALACGVPVLCAKSCNEYGSDIFEYYHYQHISEMIEEILLDYNGNCKVAIENSLKYDWRNVAKNIVKGLEVFDNG